MGVIWNTINNNKNNRNRKQIYHLSSQCQVPERENSRVLPCWSRILAERINNLDMQITDGWDKGMPQMSWDHSLQKYGPVIFWALGTYRLWKHRVRRGWFYWGQVRYVTGSNRCGWCLVLPHWHEHPSVGCLLLHLLLIHLPNFWAKL